jgi:L-2-hydroxycarboxylate dehydrogenase (NAD+)
VRNISCQVRATGRDRTGGPPARVTAWYGRRVAEVRLDELRAAVDARLRALGFDRRTAGLIGDHQVDAELRGASTHGLERLRWLAGEGVIDPGARPILTGRADGLARWDANGAVGYVALADALAAEAEVPPAGSRLVVVEGCFPTGRLGWFAELVASGGLLCLLTATSPARIAHPGGGPPVLSTSPLCLAVPGSPPAVVDVSMGRITYGDVLAASAAGEPLPPGSGVRPDGSPQDDPAEIRAGRAGIRPFGGDQAHKGLALAVLVELLVRAMSTGPGFAAVALLAAPGSDAAGRVRGLFDGRRFPGDESRARREAALDRGSIEVPDDLWEWIRR